MVAEWIFQPKDQMPPQSSQKAYVQIFRSKNLCQVPNCVLVVFSMTVIKNPPKETWKWKNLCHITDYSPSLREIRAGSQAWQNFWSRKGSRDHGRILLARLFLKTFSAYFLKALKTTTRKVKLPIMIWAIPHELSIKKMPPCLPTGPSGRDIFSIASQNGSSLCQVDIKPPSTIQHLKQSCFKNSEENMKERKQNPSREKGETGKNDEWWQLILKLTTSESAERLWNAQL